MDNRIPLTPGTEIAVNGNNYVIGNMLGCGATCLVYNAENAEQQGKVIIKELYPYGAQIERNGSKLIWLGSDAKKRHDEDIECFKKNCHVLLDLKDKEGLINFTSTVLGIFEDNNTIYLVTDIKEGQTYEEFVCDKGRSLVDIIYPIYVLSVLISAYHKYGYLHLDLKPSNFYVLTMKNRAHSINLFDVDSVVNKSQIDELPGLTYSQQWAAPELIQGNRDDIDERTDVFGIGACLFYACMGRAPEIEDIVTFHRAFDFDDNRVPKCVAEASTRIKEQLKEIFEHTIRVWVGSRYENAYDLTIELEELLKSSMQGSDDNDYYDLIRELKNWQDSIDSIDNRLSIVENKQDKIIVKQDEQSSELSALKRLIVIVACIAIMVLVVNSVDEYRKAKVRKAYEDALENGNVSEYQLNNLAYRVSLLEQKLNSIEETTIPEINEYGQYMNKADIVVDLNVRPEGEKRWGSKMDADIHDTVQWQITGINKSVDLVKDVMVKVELPTDVMYVPGSTVLYNSNYQDGVQLLDEEVTTRGINVGNYNPNGNFYVRFSTVICDNTLVSGSNELVNQAFITINGEYNSDSAIVDVYKK